MANKKLTIEEKLKKQDYKQANRFLWWFFNKIIIKLFMQPKFHPHYNIIDDINKEEGPCFVVYNHSSRSDYIWLTQACYPRRMNFVTGYNEFFRKKFKLIFKIIHQIPKKNFTTDLICMKGMKQIIKDNGIVCFSPEGMSSIVGHNQPVVNGTGKLFKHYNIPVYCMKIHGGYLTNNKVDLSDREGEVHVDFYKLFDKEDFEKNTPEELDLKLDEALWNDDYEWGQKNHIKFNAHGNICSHLHDICYRCPKCHSEFNMIGEKDYIKCNACGNTVHMNDYYEFVTEGDNVMPYESPSKWVDDERRQVIKEIREDENYAFEEEVYLGELPKYKYLKDPATTIRCGEGKIRIDHEGYHFRGTRNGEEFNFDLSYNTLFTLVVVTDCTFYGLYVNSEYLDIVPKRPTVGKQLLITEEMHRLHVNKWKNFPWMSHLYESEK